MDTKVALAIERDVQEIVHFIKDSYLPCHDWPFAILIPWVKWYCQARFCVIGRQQIEYQGLIIDGHIQTLLMGRPVLNQYLGANETFHYDFNGKFFYVDLVSTKFLSIIPVMAKMIIQVIGMKDYLAFTRDKGNMLRVHTCRTDKVLKYYAPMPC